MKPGGIQEASVVMALYGTHFHCAALQDVVGTKSTNLLFLGLSLKLVSSPSHLPPLPACISALLLVKVFRHLGKKIWAYVPCSYLFPCSS